MATRQKSHVALTFRGRRGRPTVSVNGTYAAHCSALTQPNASASSKSATTCSPASTKPDTMAGSAKSTACKSASTAPARNSPTSTNSQPERPPSTSASPPSPKSPAAPSPLHPDDQRHDTSDLPELLGAENKRGYGFHPLWTFIDHGAEGTGEPPAVLLRPGNSGSNTAADHIAVAWAVLRQPPGSPAAGSAGGYSSGSTRSAAPREVLDWIVAHRLGYSVGFILPEDFADRLDLIPDTAWTPAYTADGEIRDGAWVAEATGLLDLSAGRPECGHRPQGTPHPGAQLRIISDGRRRREKGGLVHPQRAHAG
jgi:hypothetical protein